MDKYRLETSKTEENETINDNEIRVTTQGKMRRSISYAITLFQEKKVEEITIKAMGKAISKTVNIAEIIKRRFPGLHQITEIDSTKIFEVFHPKETGLDKVETTRHVSSILIRLTTKQPENHETLLGYQPPISVDLVKPADTTRPFARRPRGRGGRRGGRGRGGRGGGRGYARREEKIEEYTETDEIPESEARGRGGRGGRGVRGGRGTGGVGGPGRRGRGRGRSYSRNPERGENDERQTEKSEQLEKEGGGGFGRGGRGGRGESRGRRGRGRGYRNSETFQSENIESTSPKISEDPGAESKGNISRGRGRRGRGSGRGRETTRSRYPRGQGASNE